ncbi:hypothetical protein B0H14DRAFT_2616452 [Mycena olivaceomarginata]|nr:hypothetical protein B0H14DRAFT_2616452 [Mycena olivaceomarginata]
MTVYFGVLVILAGLLAHAGLASTMDLNRTLFTPETSDLPAGTYIVTGIAGVTQLAEYLDTYPDTRITRLLISDSTILDVDAKHGHLFTDGSKDEIDWDKATHQKVWAVVRVFEEPLNRVFAKVAPTLEALSYLAYSAGPHGAYDEWADPRLEPLLQHNYPSLTQFNFPSRHPRRDLSRPRRGLLPAVFSFPSLTHLRTAGMFKSSTLTSTLGYVIDKFPRLTHLLVTDVGAMCELPSELYPNLRRLIPGNLTVIAEPVLSSMLNEGGEFECGNHSIQYDDYDFIFKSLRDDGVYVKLPIADYDSELGRFSLRHAIAEFLDRARGGEGEWALPERIPVREEWCRWRWQCSDPRDGDTPIFFCTVTSTDAVLTSLRRPYERYATLPSTPYRRRSPVLPIASYYATSDPPS